jgi:small subunit ribosomal protein S21
MSRYNRKQKNFEEGIKGLAVEVYNNDINKALRKFKKKVQEDGILQELRKREYYESKGTKKRKAKEAAIRRHRKQRLKEAANW